VQQLKNDEHNLSTLSKIDDDLEFELMLESEYEIELQSTQQSQDILSQNLKKSKPLFPKNKSDVIPTSLYNNTKVSCNNGKVSHSIINQTVNQKKKNHSEIKHPQ